MAPPRGRPLTHGHTANRVESPEYRVWKSINSRCHAAKPNTRAGKQYRARGVTVAAEWRGRAGFQRFFDHIGPKPEGYTIDRIDGTKGYEPGNVRWATAKEQARNTKGNVWLELDGERMILTDWAARLGMGVSSLASRLRTWDLRRALTTPKMEAEQFCRISGTKIHVCGRCGKEVQGNSAKSSHRVWHIKQDRAAATQRVLEAARGLVAANTADAEHELACAVRELDAIETTRAPRGYVLIEYTCERCGKLCRGNGGRAGHKLWHERHDVPQ